MLPFLKDNKDGGASAQPVQKMSVTDDDSYDLLDAIADDMLQAFKAGDRDLLKDALQSFKEHLQAEDQEMDEQLFPKEG